MYMKKKSVIRGSSIHKCVWYLVGWEGHHMLLKNTPTLAIKYCRSHYYDDYIITLQCSILVFHTS